MRIHKNVGLAVAISGFVVITIAAGVSAASTTESGATKNEPRLYLNDPSLITTKKPHGMPVTGGSTSSCPAVFTAQAPGPVLEPDLQDPAIRGFMITSRAQVIDSAQNYLLVRSGGSAADRSLGVLVVETLVKNPCATPDARVAIAVYTVRGHGPMKMTSTRGDLIELVFGDGRSGSFEVRTHQIAS